MLVIVFLIFGLIFGSFISATVWRIHEFEEHKSKKKKTIDFEYLKKLSILKGRSMCPSCHHQLSAKDLIPLFSWLKLQGKCRYCSNSISIKYPLVELFTATAFALSYAFWPIGFKGIGLFQFIVWLILLVGFIAVAFYDIQWYIIPTKVIYGLFAVVLVELIVVTIFSNDIPSHLMGALWGAIIGGGIFYVLFQVSKGQWIGGGDVRLGTVLGILLGGPMMSLLLLFLASCLGTIYSLPFLAKKKMKINGRIPFGPFLILAGIIVELFGTSIIVWYRRFFI